MVVLKWRMKPRYQTLDVMTTAANNAGLSISGDLTIYYLQTYNSINSWMIKPIAKHVIIMAVIPTVTARYRKLGGVMSWYRLRGVTTIGHGWTKSRGPECWGAPEFQTYFMVTENDITVCDNFTQKCVFKLQLAKFTHDQNNCLFSICFQGWQSSDGVSRHDNTPFGTSNREWDSWPTIYGCPTQYFVQGPPSS